jgi:catechol 2,3-dioxygenase-like lactoylglutathione lyase family enzyme
VRGRPSVGAGFGSGVRTNLPKTEGEGFEPSSDQSGLKRFSRPPHSTALPPLQGISGHKARPSTRCDERAARERSDPSRACSATVGRVAVQRMDHVGIVVEDLAAATAFFVELGLELEGSAAVEGGWVDRVVGLEGVRAEIAMLRTPDGHGRVELAKFLAPPSPPGERDAPANGPGIRHITFAVDDVEELVARLRGHGAELVGEIERYEQRYLLCYVRGPEGIIVELAERIG